MSRLWEDITGDSYIVDVQDTSAGDGGARYMSKYFVKDMLYDGKRKELGFARSWSRSRNWPVQTPELLATFQGRWAYVDAGAMPDYFWQEAPYTPGMKFQEAYAEALRYWIEKTEANQDGLLDYIGTDLTFEQKDDNIIAAKKERYRRLTGVHTA